jgi:hypothetical protein
LTGLQPGRSLPSEFRDIREGNAAEGDGVEGSFSSFFVRQLLQSDISLKE